MNNIKEMLFSYGMDQITITQVNDKLYKIDDGKQQFALKRSELTKETLPNWVNVFHLAKEYQLTAVLPILLTTNHALFKEMNQAFFYLMPWIQTKKPTIESLYRSIGKIHSQTQRKQQIDNEQMNIQFTNYKASCIQSQRKLLTYIKRFESHRYMSPVELQICTHYRDIQVALNKSTRYIERFIEHQTNPEQWGYGLCHGNLTVDHLLVADQSYLINWEQARHDYVVTDLVKLFSNDLVHEDVSIKAYLAGFHIYMEENKLSQQELLLLIIYLLDTSKYMDSVRRYATGTTKLTMIEQTKILQTFYRQLIFALDISKHLEAEYISVLPDDFED